MNDKVSPEIINKAYRDNAMIKDMLCAVILIKLLQTVELSVIWYAVMLIPLEPDNSRFIYM